MRLLGAAVVVCDYRVTIGAVFRIDEVSRHERTASQKNFFIMISLFDPVPLLKAAIPTYGQECACVLVQRGLIAEKDEEQVAAVIVRCSGAAEPAAAELSLRCLIASPTQAAVAEFIKRTVRRFLIKANGLSGNELSVLLGVDYVLARRIIKGTRNLTVDHIKLLVARLMLNTEMPQRARYN